MNPRVYGLKIRQILNSVFTDELSKKVGWPLETENKFSRLGIVIGIGYIMAVVYGFLGPRFSNRVLVLAAGLLTIAGTLLATVGGFGAMFAFANQPRNPRL